jgi:hypothetical protein
MSSGTAAPEVSGVSMLVVRIGFAEAGVIASLRSDGLDRV